MQIYLYGNPETRLWANNFNPEVPNPLHFEEIIQTLA